MQLFLKVEQLMMDAFLFDGCQSPKTWRIEVLTNGLSRFCQCCAQLCFSLFLRRENENLSKKSVSDQVINQFCWAQQFIFLLTTHIFFFSMHSVIAKIFCLLPEMDLHKKEIIKNTVGAKKMKYYDTLLGS